MSEDNRLAEVEGVVASMQDITYIPFCAGAIIAGCHAYCCYCCELILLMLQYRLIGML
jgi:hypothetical protein